MTSLSFLPQDVIRKKRDNKELNADDIQNFVSGIADNSISDAQIAALGMSVFFNGMTPQETAYLTLAMRDSGSVIKWTDHGFDAGAPIVDKHSTGGIGDKVSFMLAAIVSACGGIVPMIAGRGLGHTGGTVDKLEAIPGYNTMIDQADFVKITKSVGASIIGQTSALAPADKRFYAVRDVTSTVESIPLITASILSKKMAAGLHSLVMDVKFGNGAFMDTPDKALALATSIVRTAEKAGLPTSALLTDMNEVLGYTAGNAVEILETIDFLKNPENANTRLKSVVLSLTAEMLFKSGIATSSDDGYAKSLDALTSGKAAEKFAQMMASQGGPADLMDNPEKYLTIAPVEKAVYVDKAGYLSAMETREIGQIIVSMKGGRSAPGEDIDHSVGFTDFAAIGDEISSDKPICIVHAVNEDQANLAAERIKQAVTISEEKPEDRPDVLEVIR